MDATTPPGEFHLQEYYYILCATAQVLGITGARDVFKLIKNYFNKQNTYNQKHNKHTKHLN